MNPTLLLCLAIIFALSPFNVGTVAILLLVLITIDALLRK